MTDVKQQAIAEVLESWFKIRVVNINDNNIIVKIHITNDYLRMQSWTLRRKEERIVNKTVDYDSFVQDYMSKCYELLLRDGLKLTDDDWQQAANDSKTHVNVFEQNKQAFIDKGYKIVADDSFLGRISAYISKTIPFMYVDEREKKNKIKIKHSKDKYTTITFPEASYVQRTENEDSDDFSVMTLMSNDNNLYTSHTYSPNHFINYYLENKDKILSKNQLKFINGWSEADYINVTEAERVEATGVDRGNFNYYLKAISNNVLNAYNKDKPAIYTYQQRIMKEYCDLFEPLLLIYESESERMNDDMFDYLFINYKYLQPLLDMTVDEHIQINSSLRATKTLYKAFNQLLDRYEQYQNKLLDVEAIDKELTQFATPTTSINHFSNLGREGGQAIIIGGDGFAVKENKLSEESQVKVYKY